MAKSGEPMTVRLPLGIDSIVRQKAAEAGTSPQQFLGGVIAQGLTDDDSTITVTVTGRSSLIAALVASGALTTGAATSTVRTVPRGGGVASPIGPVGVETESVQQIESMGQMHARAVAAPYVPATDCTHKHRVQAGPLTRCADCGAVRGADGSWRM